MLQARLRTQKDISYIDRKEELNSKWVNDTI